LRRGCSRKAKKKYTKKLKQSIFMIWYDFEMSDNFSFLPPHFSLFTWIVLNRLLSERIHTSKHWISNHVRGQFNMGIFLKNLRFCHLFYIYSFMSISCIDKFPIAIFGVQFWSWYVWAPHKYIYLKRLYINLRVIPT
jgi:hypothetical protein